MPSAEAILFAGRMCEFARRDDVTEQAQALTLETVAGSGDTIVIERGALVEWAAALTVTDACDAASDGLRELVRLLMT